MWQEKGFEKYQTDKNSSHHYFFIYDPFFKPFQDKPIGLFEVGTNTGGSTSLWDDYFTHPDTRIRSIDILDVPASHRDYTNRVRLDIIDINDLTPEYFNNFSVDIAIDDGSHTIDDQAAFVKLLYPIVKKGGILIIEDVSAIEKLTEAVKVLNYPFFIVNFNPIDNWYDSVLFIFMK
jgi:demethylmacrocin O-methyltransferase